MPAGPGMTYTFCQRGDQATAGLYAMTVSEVESARESISPQANCVASSQPNPGKGSRSSTHPLPFQDTLQQPQVGLDEPDVFSKSLVRHPSSLEQREYNLAPRAARNHTHWI